MNIAIIDDSASDRELIAFYTTQYFSAEHICRPLLSIYCSSEEFLVQYQNHSFDLIFIDYYMDQISGMDLAKIIRKKDSEVTLIFVTASRDHAVEGYQVKASGYLVKPFSYEEFAKSLSIIDLKKLHNRRYIELFSGTNNEKIILADIIYCDVSGHYSQIHTKTSGVKRFRMSFSDLLPLLKPYPEFLMCYRGCIINLDHVCKVECMAFLMINGERIPFRKKQRTLMLRYYSEFLFIKARGDKV